MADPEGRASRDAEGCVPSKVHGAEPLLVFFLGGGAKTPISWIISEFCALGKSAFVNRPTKM